MMIGRQKRVLLLGGSFFQVPSVQTAKRLGFYTITCDYLPDNPGHKYSDEYHNVSTTDMYSVLELAKSLKIDGIVCYASDPAAPTAAYVAEKLRLPGNPYESVLTLSYKDRFRNFLREHHFSTPMAKGYFTYDEACADLDLFKFPVMVKPVDSCGSKGVTKVDFPRDLEAAFCNALKFSRSKKVVIEEFVENNGPQIIGDGISRQGELVFRAFGSHIFNKAASEGAGSPFVPIGGCWPYYKPKPIHDKLHNEIQRLLSLLEMRNCSYNFEARLDSNDNPILMEVGCRSGGNMIPQVLQYATGVDMVEFVIRSAVGDNCDDYTMVEPNGFWAYYVVHCNEEGTLKRIDIDKDFQHHHIVKFWQIKKIGDPVMAFSGANGTLGTMALRFSSMSEMHSMMNKMDSYVRVVLS